jgi:hypothetical protein
MLHEFPAEAPFAPNVTRPAELAGFASEASTRPAISPSPTVRPSNWRVTAVAGLCAGTACVALGLTLPGYSQSSTASSRSHVVLAPEPPASTPGVAVVPEPEVLSTVAKVERERALPPQSAMAVAPSVPVVRDESVIRAVLERYRRAYERLDAEALKIIWPSVDERTLAQSFAVLDSQSMRFDTCRIDIDNARGVATCDGEATSAARSGDRSIHTRTGTWTFELHKNGDDWAVDSVEQSQ